MAWKTAAQLLWLCLSAQATAQVNYGACKKPRGKQLDTNRLQANL